MRVLFDFETFLGQRTGGVSRYFCEIATHLPAGSFRIHAGLHDNQHLAELDLPGAHPGLRLPLHAWNRHLPGTIRIARSLGYLTLAVDAARWRPDVIHLTGYRSPPFLPGRAARVATIHDLIHERFPESFSAGDPDAAGKRRLSAQCDAIVCVSQTTAKDLQEIYSVDRSRITVIPHGAPDLPHPDRSRPVERPYLLYVGRRGGYKNYVALRRAYESSPRFHEHLDLICVGGGPPTSDEIPSRGTARFVTADDRQLATWYAHAEAFVYPSRYEGFGIPPLEAMQLGCPCLTGACEAVREVVGDAAALLTVGDADDIAAGLDALLGDPTRIAELRVAGVQQAARYSWRRSAAAHLALYRRLATGAAT